MRSSILLTHVLAVAAAAAGPLEDRAAPACSKNICLRVLEDQTVPFNVVYSDCVSYFQTTISPSTSTISKTKTVVATATDLINVLIYATGTTSTTVTTTQTITNPSVTSTVNTFVESKTTAATTMPYGSTKKKRQQDPGAEPFPVYAQGCTAVADYQGACSCLGVNPVTTTLPVPKTTVTSTAFNVKKTVTQFTTALTLTQTTTTTVLQTGSATVPYLSLQTHTAFKLLGNGSYNTGNWAEVWNPGQASEIYFAGPSYAATFYFDQTGNLVWTKTQTAAKCKWSGDSTRGYWGGIYFYDPGMGGSYQMAQCGVDANSLFSCTCGGGVSPWQWCADQLYMMAPGTANGSYWGNSNCFSMTLQAVPV